MLARARANKGKRLTHLCANSGISSHLMVPRRWHSETLTILQKAAEALSKSGDHMGAEEHSSPISSSVVTAGEDTDVLPSALDRGLTILCEPNAQVRVCSLVALIYSNILAELTWYAMCANSHWCAKEGLHTSRSKIDDEIPRPRTKVEWA